MKNYLYILALAIMGSTLFSCEKVLLGEAPSNDPINNFEILWKEMDEHYALFGIKDVDWDEVYNEYRPKVTETTSDTALFTICTDMIKELKDGHTFIQDFVRLEGESADDGDDDRTEAEFSLDLIHSKYLNNEFVQGEFEGLSYGKIPNTNLGYIHYLGMDDGDPAEIDVVLEFLKDTDGIVLDIRNNGGGTDSFSHRVAGAFADGEHFIYTVQTKNGPAHDDFDEPNPWYTKPIGDFQYTKPIAFLTDNYTVSAAEIFCFNMLAFDHVTHIGDNTAGDLSDISPLRALPNGWLYGFSHQLYLTPEGESLETVGFTPEIYKRNTIEEIENGTDAVLEFAIEYLQE